jgi:amino acid transporter
MIGAGINVVPIMIQRNVPGIGPHVMTAYLLAVIPALLAACSYAILSSAMPRAGGSYVFASRALHPFLGFVASFSQWFGLSIVIGVVSYLLVPFFRDVAGTLGFTDFARWLETGPARVSLALFFLWSFTLLNAVGIRIYERALVTLMLLMFIGGAVVIPAGFYFDHRDFVEAVRLREGLALNLGSAPRLELGTLLAGTTLLFSSFIGFDSIAQAGGEAKNPNRMLPLAIGIAVVTVGMYYLLFTAAVYHAVPWSFIAERALGSDLTAPGLLGYLLSPGWTVVVVAAATIALLNDLPAMLLAVSRLVFAWAEDGVFPRPLAAVNARFRTPHHALLLSALTATGGVVGSHLAGDFFLGVDILVISMLVNFMLMCLSVLMLPRRNPALAADVRFVRHRGLQKLVGGAGILTLSVLLASQVAKDLAAPVERWYFHSTYVYLLVMGAAACAFLLEWRALRRKGVDLERHFSILPPS